MKRIITLLSVLLSCFMIGAHTFVDCASEDNVSELDTTVTAQVIRILETYPELNGKKDAFRLPEGERLPGYEIDSTGRKTIYGMDVSLIQQIWGSSPEEAINIIKELESARASYNDNSKGDDESDVLYPLDELFGNDGIVTNNKVYKGYLDFVRISNSVYEFWVVGVDGGKTVTIELGSLDEAITFLENLISSYEQGNTIEIKGYSFTGVKRNTYSIPRNDGFSKDPYLVSVKNLKRDLSVLENRKKWPKVGYDDVGFFTEENKPDQYVLANPERPSISISVNDRYDGVNGEIGADILIEKRIRERAIDANWGRFNGVILGPLRHTEHLGASGEKFNNYIRSYIPIIYDSEKYQAPLTDYQKSLKRSVYRRKN